MLDTHTAAFNTALGVTSTVFATHIVPSEPKRLGVTLEMLQTVDAPQGLDTVFIVVPIPTASQKGCKTVHQQDGADPPRKKPAVSP